MSLLIIERGPNIGQRIPLLQFPVTIGRDPGNQIVLEDDEVSRFHLRIKQRGRLIIAEDLESRNGSFINGDRVLNAIVQSGDKILVGSTEFLFIASQPDIVMSNELLDFDAVVAEELGLTGPIEVTIGGSVKKFKSIRLNQLSVMNNIGQDAKLVKSVYDMHGNILVVSDLDEASRVLLKSVGQLLPAIVRAAFFIWSESNRQLLPVAMKQFKGKQPFYLSQRAFESVITRKQGVILQAEAQATQPGRIRIVLPMIHNETCIGLLHLEIDDPNFAVATPEIEVIQALLSRCAPSFETILLKKEIDLLTVGMIETVVSTVEAKDTYTRGHSERVSKYCMAVAEELKLNREIKKILMISALCHDIGKIGVPDAILKKAALLSAEEYAEMKLHPNIGADIIQSMPNAKRFISGVKHHHEKWDGTGYPDGLAGEEIPFFGRIVAIADVFDAMVSGRSYSGFMDQNDAIEKLAAEKDLFDPVILKAFINAHENGILTLKNGTQNQALPTDSRRIKKPKSKK